jgi:serine/threonine protein kinase
MLMGGMQAEFLEKVRMVLYEHGYQMLDCIGHGSFASVYRVLSLRYPDTIFVAKVFVPAPGHQTDDTGELFHRELTVHRNLDHVHIVSLFDFFEEDGIRGLILEYCENGQLDQYVSLHRLTGKDLSDLLRQVAIAVAYLHSCGVAHRDIKPANILIDKYGRAKLSDFGLAWAIGQDEVIKTAGSFIYMAPEVLSDKIRGLQDMFSADIWSLAVTFYFVRCGSTPWPDTCAISELRDVMEHGIIHFPKEVGAGFQRMVRQMTNPRPQRRPAADELVNDPYFRTTENIRRLVDCKAMKTCFGLRSHGQMNARRRENRDVMLMMASVM